VVGVVVEFPNSVSNPDGTLDTPSNDFFANLLSEDLFAQVWHDRAIKDGPVSQNRPIAEPRAVALAGARRQPVGDWLASRRGTEEFVQGIAIYRAAGPNRSGEARHLADRRTAADRRPVANAGQSAGRRAATHHRPVQAGQRADYRTIADATSENGPRGSTRQPDRAWPIQAW
jgi:hypothetical protein